MPENAARRGGIFWKGDRGLNIGAGHLVSIVRGSAGGLQCGTAGAAHAKLPKSAAWGCLGIITGSRGSSLPVGLGLDPGGICFPILPRHRRAASAVCGDSRGRRRAGFFTPGWLLLSPKSAAMQKKSPNSL